MRTINGMEIFECPDDGEGYYLCVFKQLPESQPRQKVYSFKAESRADAVRSGIDCARSDAPNMVNGTTPTRMFVCTLAPVEHEHIVRNGVSALVCSLVLQAFGMGQKYAK